MSKATMVFADKDGQIDFSIVFDGGFKPDSPAHQHAQIVLKMLDDMMGAKTKEDFDVHAALRNAADNAIRQELLSLCLPSTDKNSASRVGAIAGVFARGYKDAPKGKEAIALWNMYSPFNVVAVPDSAIHLLPKLEPFESLGVCAEIIGKCGDIIFVRMAESHELEGELL